MHIAVSASIASVRLVFVAFTSLPLRAAPDVNLCLSDQECAPLFTIFLGFLVLFELFGRAPCFLCNDCLFNVLHREGVHFAVGRNGGLVLREAQGLQPPVLWFIIGLKPLRLTGVRILPCNLPHIVFEDQEFIA